MRSFCRQAAGLIREGDYILLHYQRRAYVNAALEMDRLLDLRQTLYSSLCCRRGQIKSRREGGHSRL